MKNIFLIFLFPILVLGQNKKAVKYFDAGEKSQGEKNHIEAINQFKLAIKKYPKYYEAYNEIGNSFRVLDNLDSALFYHSKSVNLNTKYSDGYWSKAMTYIYLEEYEKSITEFTKYIELVGNKYPENFYGYFKRANIKSLMKDYNDAIFDFTMALSLDSVNISTGVVNKTGLYLANSIDAYINRSQAFNYLSNFSQSKNDIKKAILLTEKLNNTDKEKYNWLYLQFAGIYWREAEYNTMMYDSALYFYKKHIEINPTDFVFHYMAGECLRLMNRNDEAYLYYKLSLDSIPDYNTEIIIDLLTEPYRDSINYIEKQIELYDYAISNTRGVFPDYNTENYLIYNNRGRLKNMLQDYEGALVDLNMAIKIAPDNYAAYNNRGNTYSGTSDFEEAFSDYTKAIELNPNYTYAYYNRGLVNFDLDEYEEAISDFTKAISLNSEFANAYLFRAHSKRYWNNQRTSAPLEFCSDYKKACILDYCEGFEEYCK